MHSAMVTQCMLTLKTFFNSDVRLFAYTTRRLLCPQPPSRSAVFCVKLFCASIFTRSIATERMQCLPRRLCFTRRCLIVYLSLWNLVKTTDHIFMKILPNMYLWTRKIHLNVRSHLRLNHEDSTTEKLQHRTAQCTSHIPLSPWSGAIYN